MSDLSIPGVNSQYEKLIEAIMKSERIPRDRVSAELDKYELQNNSWTQVGRISAELRDISRSLYSFNNPFFEKIAESSNEKAFTAVAARDIKDQTAKLSIIQTASADSFLSKEITKDLKVPKGQYTFRVGEKDISLNWNGGSYKSFAEALNKRGKGTLSVSEIKPSQGTSALLFSSELTGEKNKLQFENDALSWALELELIKKNDSSPVEAEKNELSVSSASSEKINFSETVRAKNQYVMELSVVLEQDFSSNNEAASQTFEKIGFASHKGVMVQNIPSQTGYAALPEGQPPAAEEVIDMNILSLESSRGVLIPLPEISGAEGRQTLTIPLSEYGDVKALAVNNKNSGLKIKIEDIKILDPKAQGDYIPVNPASVAEDAVIMYQGIQMKREKNEIDDVIPGVTLHLHDKTDKQETLKIMPNVELAKNAIIEFTAKYNRLMAEINILTSNRPEIISEIEYFSDEEREAANKKLGIMHGDTTLLSLKTRLRQNSSSSYGRNSDSSIKILSQMGISSKADNSGGVDASRLRGYLEIDEKELENALTSKMKDIKTFFGYDSDGDLLVDSGLAFDIYELINPYVQRGGIFSAKSDSLNGKIKSSEQKIEDYDKKLARKEAELKRKYGQLEGTLKSLKKQSDSISNFNKSQDGK